MLVHAIIVAGNRACADVDAAAHGGVADVGEVRDLGALTNRGLLDLYVGAGLGTVEHVGAGAQVGARATIHAVLERDVDGDGLVDDAAVAGDRVGEAGVGAELAAFAHVRVADEVGLRPNDSVAADGGVGADPGLSRVDEGDAFGHPVLVDAVASDAGELGELRAGVHAQAVAIVGSVEDGHVLAGGLENLDHVGQVVLVLGILAGNVTNVGGELGAVKGVAAGVALQQGLGLLGRAVLLLDDALDGAVRVELDAPVAKGLGRGEGQYGCGVRAVGDGLRELRDGLGLDEGQVTVEHDHGPLADAAGLDRDAHGVTGAQALGLLHRLDGNGGACVGAVEDRADLVGVAAHHDDHAVAAGGDGRVDDPADHRLAQDFVRDLGVVGLHAGSLAGSEDDGGGVCHGWCLRLWMLATLS